MTIITRPLDIAAAHTLNDISTWAAEELAARIAAKSMSARIGYSNQSCSRYVDIDLEDETICVRVSDHEAMSYNRTGNYNIGLIRDRKYFDASAYVSVTAIYSVTEYTFDDDGEVITGDTYFIENGDEDEAEFEGFKVDIDSLVAAIDSAEAFLIRRCNG